MKIGIMGGTFNPIHNGHLILAEVAYEQIGLDKVLFMPLKNPPHKNKLDVISDEHRANMIHLAISDNPHFEFSDFELNREGTTYTKDTLKLLSNENPDSEYYFIVGADSFFMIDSWKEPKEIFQYCTLVVAGRDHVKKDRMKNQSEYLKNKYEARIIQLEMPTIQLSSVIIRERLTQKKSIRYYVPDAVISYIKEKDLYQETDRK